MRKQNFDPVGKSLQSYRKLFVFISKAFKSLLAGGDDGHLQIKARRAGQTSRVRKITRHPARGGGEAMVSVK
ncbi:MAG: hypothetical protein PVS2B2_24530 [Candidatus Acidiferrum sp.]